MVHLFQKNDFNIALDSASGAVHLLSDIAYDLLAEITPPMPQICPQKLLSRLAPVYGQEKVNEAYNELYELFLDKQLFSEDIPVQDSFFKTKTIKALCLHISHDCNLRCRYCFADCGEFHRTRSLMTGEVGRRALDFLIEHSGKIKNLEVDFFGGEPLLNFDVVREITIYGRELEKKHNKTIRFTMTTNGTLLNDEVITFLNEHMYNIVLSIDGTPETNDALRFYADGSGCYHDILPKYKALVAGRGNKSYYVRGTFTRETMSFTDDVLHLADCGFEHISIEPVVLPNDHPLSLRQEDLPRIFAEYDRLAEAIIKRTRQGRPFNFFHFMVDLDAGPCVYKRVKGCGSGCEYVAVTPEGDVYPCHQFVEHTECKLGNIFEDELRKDLRDRFSECNICNVEECRTCWAKYFCGGGCPANNYKYSEGISRPYKIACELQRKRVECALYIKAALAE
ncbi:MAG: thioether cross-link-forming SCIFF peptide maturase [Clostridiales bacterium]|nr:thioether cross-link-forming SCIFF peptide maturase [Clostridiales bacterium]